MDRFDLENDIMSCWNTKEDILLLAESFSEKNITEDEVQNALIGIASLHELRCQKLINTFEELIYNNSKEKENDDKDIFEMKGVKVNKNYWTNEF